MDRLIIESTEGRIMLGVTMFVAIMILVGWVAINEPARMAEFVEQHEGRSIERGAELFAANCSPCHGIEGYGIGGRAPALHNPHLFGYSYVGAVNAEIGRLQRERLDILGISGLQSYEITDQLGILASLELDAENLRNQMIEAPSQDAARDPNVQLLIIEARLNEDVEGVAARIAAIEEGNPLPEDVNPELDLSPAEEEARLAALQDNIPTRLAEIELALNGDGTEENPGLLAQREALLADLDAARLRNYLPRLDEVRALVDELENDATEGNEYPLFITNYIDQDADRLSQIEFGGSLVGYITTTLIHGRPGSGTVWNGNIMVSWSQRAGGPLRDDQIGDLVAYITNWDKGDNWTIDDFNAVNQYAIIHAPYTPGGGKDFDQAGTNVEEILASFPEGDAAHGEELYNGAAPLASGQVAGCAGCHLGGTVGPDTVGTWTRVQNQRLTLPEFAGYTGEQYLIESIVQPNAFVAPGFTAGVMLGNYGDIMSAQDLADIVAYLQTQNQ